MDKLKEKVLCKNINRTHFGNNYYSGLWYVDNINKIVVTFTPRGACSKSFCQFLDLVGLLEDGTNYHPFIHHYRIDLIDANCSYVKIDDLVKNNYTFIKFIINPYIRAVSIYTGLTTNNINLSFREFLKHILNNTICNILNKSDIFHTCPQYTYGEESIITKYIKINENEKYTIKLANDTYYEIDVNKYKGHSSKRTDNSEFCGDISRKNVMGKLPKSYKHFYDDEIKTMVETYYKNDIEKYGFSFDNF